MAGNNQISRWNGYNRAKILSKQCQKGDQIHLINVWRDAFLLPETAISCNWKIQISQKACNPYHSIKKIFHTLDFRAVGRALGVPIWLITVFCDSISKEGKRGVPGGVKSLTWKRFPVNSVILKENNLT